MPRLGPPALPASANNKLRGGKVVSPAEALCRRCAKCLAPGETVCRACGERMTPAAKPPAGPHPLIVLFFQVPVGFGIQVATFVFLCRSFSGSTAYNGVLVLCAVILCVAWLAVAICLTRNPASLGYGAGMLVGACLTGLLTGACAISK